jgi:hypothetical protein
MLTEYVKYDTSSVEKCHNKTYERSIAYLYTEYADRTKYGSTLVGLNTQQSLGNNQYPKTVTKANNVLSNHKLDTPNKSKKCMKNLKTNTRRAIQRRKKTPMKLKSIYNLLNWKENVIVVGG